VRTQGLLSHEGKAISINNKIEVATFKEISLKEAMNP
jgi:hypothetical protein